MPIKTTCPDCDKAYNLADTMEGKTVKCKDCGNSFTVEAASNGVAAKPSNGKAKAGSTATKTAKPAVKKPVVDDDDEDDEDGGEEEAPAKKGGMGKFVLIGGALVAVLMLFVCGGVGVGGYFIYRSYNSPDETASNTSTKDKDGDKDKSKDKDGSNKDKDNPNKDKDNPNKDKDNTTPPVKGISLAAFQQIKSGMTIAAVENILGTPFTKAGIGDNHTTISVWSNFQDSITITYYDGVVKEGVGFFGQKTYNVPTDPKTGPGTNPPGASVTKVGFDKIMGGETEDQISAILGTPFKTNTGVLDNVTITYDKTRVSNWVTGNNVINVTFCDGKAAYWSGIIDGVILPAKKNEFYVRLKAAANPPGMVTQAAFDQIKGGETENELTAILGKLTNADNKPFDAETAKYEKLRCLYYYAPNNKDVVVVALCDGRAAYWTGSLDNKVLPPKSNQMWVRFKGGNPNPNAKLTKAAYDGIKENQTGVGALLQAFGNTPQGSNGKDPKKDPNGFRYIYIWTEGDARIEVHANLNGIVTNKKEGNLK